MSLKWLLKVALGDDQLTTSQFAFSLQKVILPEKEHFTAQLLFIDHAFAIHLARPLVAEWNL